MEGMKEFPDKYFGLAIVDPPYGINGHKQRVFNDGKQWDTERPSTQYFDELRRVSKKYIVWGGNYFAELFPCKGFIIWDKRQPEDITFGMVELAASNLDMTPKMFFTKPAGERGFYVVDEKRIHPTQKPIALYKWLLGKFASEGDLILDTHVGSASSLIACESMGFEYVGFEIDKDYYEAAVKRLENFRKQIPLDYKLVNKEAGGKPAGDGQMELSTRWRKGGAG